MKEDKPKVYDQAVGINWPLFASLLAVGAALAILWARTGLVPAASGGDEIFSSESGYQFMHEGVLRWAFLNDNEGSGKLSFWPPVAPLLQSVMMRLFGVTPFGICAQSSLVCSMIMLFVYLLCRSLGIESVRSLLASCSIFGLLIVNRSLTTVRMESLTALAVLIFAWLIINAADTSNIHRQTLLAAIAGLVMGTGLFCYYPHSPFFLLGCVAGLLTIGFQNILKVGTAVFVGCLPIIIGGLIWILPHWGMFRQQVLEAGSKYYLSFANLMLSITDLLAVSNLLTWWQLIECWGVILLGLIVIICSTSVRLRMVAVMAAALALPMFCRFPNSRPAAAGVLGIVLLFGLQKETRSTRFSFWLCTIQCALVAVGLLSLGMMAFTAYYQREGRDYSVVQASLRESVKVKGPVAISQRAWLGLRETIPAADLNFLVYASPAALANMPVAAQRSDADDYFSYIVLEQDKIPLLKKLYPWIGRGIASGKFKLIKEVKPLFKPLPWAKERCYDLLIFERITPPFGGTTPL
jgi:hypothetical protein